MRLETILALVAFIVIAGLIFNRLVEWQRWRNRNPLTGFDPPDHGNRLDSRSDRAVRQGKAVDTAPADDGFGASVLIGQVSGMPIGPNPAGAAFGAMLHDAGDDMQRRAQEEASVHDRVEHTIVTDNDGGGHRHHGDNDGGSRDYGTTDNYGGGGGGGE